MEKNNTNSSDRNENDLIKQYAKDILIKNFKGLKIKEVLWFSEFMKEVLAESLLNGEDTVK